MKAYQVILDRKSSRYSCADTRYYVIIDVEHEEEARRLALEKARSDYPDDVFHYQGCKRSLSRGR